MRRGPTVAQGECSSVDSIPPSRSSFTNAYCTSTYSAGAAGVPLCSSFSVWVDMPSTNRNSPLFLPRLRSSRGSSSSSYSQPNNSHALWVEIASLATSIAHAPNGFTTFFCTDNCPNLQGSRKFAPPTHNGVLSFPPPVRAWFTPLLSVSQISVLPPAPPFFNPQIGCFIPLQALSLACTARTGHLPLAGAPDAPFPSRFASTLPIGRSEPVPPRQIAPRAYPPTCPISPYSAHLTERGVC